MRTGARNDGSIAYEIRGLFTFTTDAGGQATRLINPTLTTQTQSLAALFAQFRFTNIKFSLQPPRSASAPPNVLGVLAGANDTTASTAPNSASLAFSTVGLPGTTVPAKVTVPRRYLIDDNAQKWWKTAQGTADLWDANQGRIYFNGDVSTTFNVYVKAVVEFSAPNNNLTPSPLGGPALRIASSHVPLCQCAACQAASGTCTSLKL